MLNRTCPRTLPAAALAVLALAGSAFAQSASAPATQPADANRSGATAIDPNSLRVDANAMLSAMMGADPNEVRRDMSERMRVSLGATVEEWKVLSAKLEKVQKLQQQYGRRGRSAMYSMGMGVAGVSFGDSDSSAEPTELEKAYAALTGVLGNEGISASDLKNAIKDYREARAKLRAELDKAQKDLKEFLTIRQEATLKQMGILN
jgi:hypothetical protein